MHIFQGLRKLKRKFLRRGGEEKGVAGRKEIGVLGEKLAQKHLQKRGYKILESNFRCPLGEIDIVAQKKETLVFVEVRTRSSTEFGAPEESITEAKKRKLVSLANFYLKTHQTLSPFWRIDVVAVEVGDKGKPSRVELIDNAIGAFPRRRKTSRSDLTN